MDEVECIFAPCSRCSSTEYDKAAYDFVAVDEESGMCILEPIACDQCSRECAEQLPH